MGDYEVIDTAWPVTLRFFFAFIDLEAQKSHRWMYPLDPSREIEFERQRSVLYEILDRRVADPSLVRRYKEDPEVLASFDNLYSFNFFERSIGFRPAQRVIDEFDAIVRSLPFSIDDWLLCSFFAQDLPSVFPRRIDPGEKLPYSLDELKAFALLKDVAIQEKQKTKEEERLQAMLSQYNDLSPEVAAELEQQFRKSMEEQRDLHPVATPYNKIPDIEHLIRHLSRTISLWIGESPDLVSPNLVHSDESEGHYKLEIKIKKCDSQSPCGTETKVCWDGSVVHRVATNECEFTECPKKCYGLPERGECSESITRYYWESYSQSCEEFIWSGCGGNGNNFASEGECLSRCGLKLDL
jgi:hypothetical protein